MGSPLVCVDPCSWSGDEIMALPVVSCKLVVHCCVVLSCRYKLVVY